MINKIYEDIKIIIKQNYIFFIIYAVLVGLFFIPTSYEINMPGGLLNVSDKFVIEESYDSKGSFNSTYVSSMEASVPLYLLSFIMPSWDLNKISNSQLEDESYEEIFEREKLSLKAGVQNSIYWAYTLAGKEAKITKEDLTVMYISSKANTNLKVGDIIREFDGIKINRLSDLEENIDLDSINKDKITIKVLRNNKEEDIYAYPYIENGKRLIGFYFSIIYELDTTPKVEYIPKDSESGSSGGLMNALQVYNMLTKEDLTKGKVISGTGTLEIDGTVGEIGGVKYKLAGAVKNKAEIFLVPTDNYEEAIKEKEKNNYNINIIEATSLEAVIKLLKEL